MLFRNFLYSASRPCRNVASSPNIVLLFSPPFRHPRARLVVGSQPCTTQRRPNSHQPELRNQIARHPHILRTRRAGIRSHPLDRGRGAKAVVKLPFSCLPDGRTDTHAVRALFSFAQCAVAPAAVSRRDGCFTLSEYIRTAPSPRASRWGAPVVQLEPGKRHKRRVGRPRPRRDVKCPRRNARKFREAAFQTFRSTDHPA